jgi:hypothetical protein
MAGFIEKTNDSKTLNHWPQRSDLSYQETQILTLHAATQNCHAAANILAKFGTSFSI